MATTNYDLLASLLYDEQTPPKRRCFISYHHADEGEVQAFLDTYSNGEVFTHRALGLDMTNDIVESNDTDYVMRRIRDAVHAEHVSHYRNGRSEHVEAPVR